MPSSSRSSCSRLGAEKLAFKLLENKSCAAGLVVSKVPTSPSAVAVLFASPSAMTRFPVPPPVSAIWIPLAEAFNVAFTFSPAVADFFIYVIDTAGGEKYPRKNGLGIIQSDFLVINKKDLAPYVGADLAVMERDARAIRKGKPFVFTNCKTGEGLDQLEDLIMKNVLLM